MKHLRSFALLVVRSLLRLFFRRIEVAGRENVPTDVGGVFVAWHPNGLIDPALILATSPRPVVFGARHGLFSIPVLKTLVTALGTVPIYRADDAALDEAGRREANRRSLDALSARVRAGDFAALFPEGKSHDAPHLIGLKTGVARLFEYARRGGGPAPVIVPVGLHYDQKRAFRSHVLVVYHPPLKLPDALANPPTENASEEVRRDRYRRLTAEIERVLAEVVLATDDWRLHHLMHRARKIVRTERARRADLPLGRANMEERAIGFARIRLAYLTRSQTHPEEVKLLESRVEEYHENLRALGIEDHELDSDPRLLSGGLAGLLVLQAFMVYLLLPPILVVGYLVNGPPALALRYGVRALSTYKKDEATLKALLGVALFPGAWISAGLLGAWTHAELLGIFPTLPAAPWVAGVVLAVSAAVGGGIALRYLHLASGTARAIRVRLTKRSREHAVARLRTERAAIFDAMMALADGLELPETVAPIPTLPSM